MRVLKKQGDLPRYGMFIATPYENWTFREESTVVVSGCLLKGGRVIKMWGLGAPTDDTPYDFAVRVRDERGTIYYQMDPIRFGNVAKFHSSFFSFSFDMPRLSSTGIGEVELEVIVRFWKGGELPALRGILKLFVQDATTNDSVPVTPAGNKKEDFGVKLASPDAGPDGFAARRLMRVMGTTAKVDEDAWVTVVLYDKATGVISDMNVAPWTKYGPNGEPQFKCELIPTRYIEASDYILEAQVRRRLDGELYDSGSLNLRIDKEKP